MIITINSRQQMIFDNSTSRQSSPRSFPNQRSRKQKELPRYDVRNVINRKRATKNNNLRPSRSRSPKSPVRSRSRSRSRSRQRFGKRLSRSPPLRRSRSPKANRRKNRSRSRSVRSRSKSRSPLRSRSRNNRRRDRSWSGRRSRSPRRRLGRRSPSPLASSLTSGKKNKKRRSRSRENLNKKKNKNRARSSKSSSRSPVRKSKKNSKNKNVSKTRRIVEEEHHRPAKKSKKTKKNKEKDKRQSNRDNLLFNNSAVADKEVFTSGDKIMVSVNFKNASNKPAAEIAATKKPSMVIDIMTSPYQVLEASPEPVVDVFSDDEAGPSKMTEKQSKQSNKQNTINDHSDHLLHLDNNKSKDISSDALDVSKDSLDHIETHKGPCTPPNAPDNSGILDLAKGPQTPEDPDDSYDPCDPTDSPPGPNGDDDNEPLLHSGSSSSGDSPRRNEESLLKTAANTVPFLMEDSLIQRLESNGKLHDDSVNNGHSNNDSLDHHPVDMDMDSPFSPQSSEGSDIFEPPSLHTPSKKKGKSNGILKSQSKFSGKF